MIDLERPSVSAVREACRLFHEENEAEERALRELFLRFRKNSDAAEVILKVVAVNSIYSTNVFAFRELAKQLHACSAQLDPLIEARDLAAFDLIEYLNLPNKKPRS